MVGTPWGFSQSGVGSVQGRVSAATKFRGGKAALEIGESRGKGGGVGTMRKTG